jgi:hypothetical protein
MQVLEMLESEMVVIGGEISAYYQRRRGGEIVDSDEMVADIEAMFNRLIGAH